MQIPVEAVIGSLQPYKHTQELKVAWAVLKASMGIIQQVLEARLYQ